MRASVADNNTVAGEATDAFEIRIGSDFIRLALERVWGFPHRTCAWGGYDAQGWVDIQCGPYRVHGPLWFSTGEVWQFYDELRRTYDELSGQARFHSYEDNLMFTLMFTARGQVTIRGVYQARPDNDSRLDFELVTDQSYLAEPLDQLAQFIAKYGDNRGVHR
jgi:hypothetical protein